MRCRAIVGTFLTLLLAGCVTRPQPSLVPTEAETSRATASLTTESPTELIPKNTQTLTATPPLAISTSTPVPITATSTLAVQSIVLSGHLGWVGSLAWSPDGARLAAVRFDLGNPASKPEVWVFDVKAGTGSLAAPGATLPAWLP